MNFFNYRKEMFRKYLLFMVPAMLIAAKGFADLWISGSDQPWLALTVLALANVMALMDLTLVSAAVYLLKRSFWIPPCRLIVLITGMELYFRHSLGRTSGVRELAVPVAVWLLWSVLAYRSRKEPERL